MEITHGHPVALPACLGVCFPGKNIYLAILTSMFLHAGVVHLAGNMLFLWIFGNNIEDTLGRVAFLAFYLVCAGSGGAQPCRPQPGLDVPHRGSQRAVAGVLGPTSCCFPRAKVLTGIILIVYIQFIRLPAAMVLGACSCSSSSRAPRSRSEAAGWRGRPRRRVFSPGAR